MTAITTSSRVQENRQPEIRVGLPRTMVYYYLYPYFRGFFDALDIPLLASAETSQETLNDMTSSPTDELCVPVKLTFAHAKRLKAQGITHLLIPTLVSIDPNNFCCPKFIGLPTMVGKAVGYDDDRLLRPIFNFREHPSVHREELARVAHQLGVEDEGRISVALDRADAELAQFHRLTREEALTVPEALHQMYRVPRRKRRDQYNPRADFDPDLKVGVIGHPYVMYDLLGQHLVDRLREYGHVVTPEMVEPDDIRAAVSTVYQGERMWTFEGEKLGAAFHLIRNQLVDRLILVGPFGCGPQSVMENFILAECERLGVPFLHLTVDEHTGEAGLVTRLEAFMDMRRVESPSVDAGDSPYKSFYTHRAPGTKRRVVGTPSMGLLDVGMRTILETCGVEVLPTPPLSEDLIERGRQIAPEFICYPLVGVTAQIEELLRQGADTIAMITGKGRCRAGWYGQVQKVLLERAGYDFDMVLIDAPLPIKTNWKPFKDAVQALTGGVSWLRVIRGIYFGYRKLAVIDRADEVTRELRAYETEPGTGDRLYERLVRRVNRAATLRALNKTLRDFEEAAAQVPRLDIEPLRVQVLGEIYVVLEPFINREIEKVLTRDPRTRVHVVRELTASSWFAQHVLRHPGLWKRYHEVAEAAKPYIGEHLGGHGTEDVGLTILGAEEGLDGVVHLVPFTCMPELVAQNLLTHVSREHDIPVLSLIISEQTGEAGFVTRVEAFLDTLVDRRRRAQAPLPLVSVTSG